MNYWKQFHFESVIRKILLKSIYTPKPDHHFGRPFLSAYQIAIEFNKLDPKAKDAVGAGAVGGLGSNTYDSLAKYIANQLSRRIKKGTITYIEGGFFSNLDLKDIIFDNAITSSSTYGKYDLSIYRIKREYSEEQVLAIPVDDSNDEVSQEHDIE